MIHHKPQPHLIRSHSLTSINVIYGIVPIPSSLSLCVLFFLFFTPTSLSLSLSPAPPRSGRHSPFRSLSFSGFCHARSFPFSDFPLADERNTPTLTYPWLTLYPLSPSSSRTKRCLPTPYLPFDQSPPPWPLCRPSPIKGFPDPLALSLLDFTHALSLRQNKYI
jgi:hypothetical protein